MPTAIATARSYAAPRFSYGSRLARSMVQGDPGPSLFAPGTVSGASVVTKLAHAILAYGSQKQAAEMNQRIADQAQQKSDLEIAALKQRTDPSYMTDYQRGSLDVRQANEKRLEDPQPTPRAKVHLGADLAQFYGLGPEGDYDPDQIAAARGRFEVQNHGAAGRAADAVRELQDYDRQRKAAADAAESSVRASMQTEIDALSNPKTTRTGRAKALRILGLPAHYDTKNPVPESAFANAIAQARLAAEARHDSLTAGKRAAAHAVIQRESGTLLMDDTNSALEALRQRLEAATGE